MGSDGTGGHREESGLSFTVTNDTKLKAKWLQVRERGRERETMEHNSHLVSSKSSMIRVHLDSRTLVIKSRLCASPSLIPFSFLAIFRLSFFLLPRRLEQPQPLLKLSSELFERNMMVSQFPVKASFHFTGPDEMMDFYLNR